MGGRVGLAVVAADEDDEEDGDDIEEGRGASWRSAPLPLASQALGNLLMLPLCPEAPALALSTSSLPMPSPIVDDGVTLSWSCLLVEAGLKWNGVPSVVEDEGVELNPDVAEASLPVDVEVATEEEEERNSSSGRRSRSVRGERLRV